MEEIGSNQFLFVAVLVFLMMFSLLAKLIRQGRRGRL